MQARSHPGAKGARSPAEIITLPLADPGAALYARIVASSARGPVQQASDAQVPGPSLLGPGIFSAPVLRVAILAIASGDD